MQSISRNDCISFLQRSSATGVEKAKWTASTSSFSSHITILSAFCWAPAACGLITQRTDVARYISVFCWCSDLVWLSRYINNTKASDFHETPYAYSAVFSIVWAIKNLLKGKRKYIEINPQPPKCDYNDSAVFISILFF